MGFWQRLLSHIPGTSARKTSKLRRDLPALLTRSIQSAMEDRRRPNWNMFGLFEHGDMTQHLPMLRHRSRLLKINDDTARGLIKKDVTNVIGPGFSVQAYFPNQLLRQQGLSADKPYIEELTSLAEEFFKESVFSSMDFDEQRTRTYLQTARMRFDAFKTDGEVFTHYRLADNRSLPFCMNIIPPDSVDSPPSLLSDKHCKRGVQFLEDGSLEGYWVCSANRASQNFKLITPSNSLGLPRIRHYFDPEQPSMARGLPWLTTVILALNDISDYLDSELQTKIVEACVALIVQSENPTEMEEAMRADPTLSAGYDSSTSNTNPRMNQWPKKQIHYLNKGEEIKQVEWNRPGSTFEPFLNELKRRIGNGVSRSFERVSNNYGAANFSATRVSGIEDNVEYESEFNLFSTVVLNPDWEWAMWAAAIEYGEPLLRFCRPRWQRYIKPSWDELKDAKAATERIDNGTSDQRKEAARIGNDIDAVIDNRIDVEKRLKAKKKEAGLADNAGEPSLDAAMDAKLKKMKEEPEETDDE
jgi:lambda family phage portal protein